MTTRDRWRACLIAGLAMMSAAIGFGQFAGLKACTPPAGLAPIIAFEMARVPEQVSALFAASACAQAQSSALWLDALLFIPAYTLFLCFGALAAGGRFAKAAIACVVLAALLDQAEGVVLWRILDAPPGDPGHFALLVPVVRAKFALLGAGALLIGGDLLRSRGVALLPGVAMIAGGAMTLVSVADDTRTPVMMTGASISWLTLLAWAAISALRAVPSQNPQA